jgi:integral membrane sensor domain MASE1
MAKITAWLVTLIGVLLILQVGIPDNFSGKWVTWVIALAVLIIGITKLARNYQKKGRR